MKTNCLMAVHESDSPNLLKMSLESLMFQTVNFDKIIIVADGRLTDELNALVLEYSIVAKHFGVEPVVVYLLESCGLGGALAMAQDLADGDLIFRHDSDDIAMSYKVELGIYLISHFESIGRSSILIGFDIEERTFPFSFKGVKRCVPSDQKAIIDSCQVRNPFNHVTTVMTSDIKSLFPYRPISPFEDYELWLRIIHHDQQVFLANVPIAVEIVSVDDFAARRRGWRYLSREISFFYSMLQSNYISYKSFILQILFKPFLRMAPIKIFNIIFKLFR